MNKFEIWLANLNPSKGTELGKVRPVLVLQNTDLAGTHPSTLVCPFSSSQWRDNRFRVKYLKESTGLQRDSFLVIDQIRALDNKRFIQRLGFLSEFYHSDVNSTLKILFDLT